MARIRGTQYRITLPYDSRNQMLSQTDALGRTTSYSYDLEGRMLSVASNSTQFAYDARSNRIQMTDTLGRVTAYSYDQLNRLLEENQQSLNAITKYSYDAASNLTVASHSTTVSFPKLNIIRFGVFTMILPPYHHNYFSLYQIKI